METETNHAENGEPAVAEQVEVHHKAKAPAGGQQVPVMGGPAGRNWRGRKPWAGGLVVLVLIVLAFGGGWLLSRSNGDQGSVSNQTKSIDHSGFQAVFLTNGQVYFGKLDNISDKYVTITNIFYLQVQQNLQAGTAAANASADSNSQVSLAKLGNELHGPKDEMYVASDQVLFWENLKSDSKVVQAIDKYQSQ